MGNPKFDSNSVALVFKGEVTPAKDYAIPFVEQRKIPYVVDPTGKDVQLYISDYFLNTTLYSMHQNGLIDFDIRTTNGTAEGDPLRIEMLSILFPDITKHLDPKAQMSIRVRATDGYIPNFNIINKDESIAKMVVEISFATLDSQFNRIPFIEVVSNVTVEVDFEITSPFKLNTDVKQLKIKADKLQLDKYSLTNLADLNSIIGTASGFIRNYVNMAYSGYTFGELDLGFIKIDVNQTSMFERERYIYADMAPHFTHSITHQVNRKDKFVPREPMTYQEKVNAVANILKLTPIYENLKQLNENSHVYGGIANIGGFGAGFVPAEDDDEEYPQERTHGEEPTEMTE